MCQSQEEEILESQINGLGTNSENRDIKDFYRGRNEYKEG